MLDILTAAGADGAGAQGCRAICCFGGCYGEVNDSGIYIKLKRRQNFESRDGDGASASRAIRSQAAG